MNGIVNKLLLARDKFIPEMHLKQPGFDYSACGPFTKSRERISKFKEKGDTKSIYKNELDKTCFQHDMAYGYLEKTCFQHDMAYGYFKDLARRIASDKFLRNKAFNIAKTRNYDKYQRDLASMVYKFFDKKTKVSGIKNEIMDI